MISFKGTSRYLITFPKGRKSWVAKPILEDKDYTHLVHMMEDVVHTRMDRDKHELFDYDIPDTIPRNIASVERPSKEQVIAQHISRFPAQSTTHST